MNATVLIVEPKLAPVLGKRLWSDPRFSVFPVTEALRALEIIVRRPPTTVILDPTFVTTSRGTALIARIRQDPRLTQFELRILTQANDLATIPLTEPRPSVGATMTPPVLDRWGTRRAVRVPMKVDVSILVNGRRCALVNLSAAGAQILSPVPVSPQQPVRVALVDGSDARFDALVVWSAAERVGADLQFRAGISFTNLNGRVLESFCRRYGVPTAAMA